jgi:hypothetical protein
MGMVDNQLIAGPAPPVVFRVSTIGIPVSHQRFLNGVDG